MDRKDYNKFCTCTCVEYCHLCALKFIVQCNKVGSVEKLKIRKGSGSVLGTRLIHTYARLGGVPGSRLVLGTWLTCPAYIHAQIQPEMVVLMHHVIPGSLIITCQGSVRCPPPPSLFLTLPTLLHRSDHF